MLRQTVALWSDEMLERVIDDWHRFEQDGAIGDCSLRHAARIEVAALGAPSFGVTTMMRDIAFEVFRRIAMERRPDLGDEASRGQK